MSTSPSSAINKSLINQNIYDSKKITQTIVVLGQAHLLGEFRGTVNRSDGKTVGFSFEVQEQSPYPTIDLDLSLISDGDSYVVEKDGYIQVHSSEDTENTFSFSIERTSAEQSGDIETLLSNSQLQSGNTVVIIALQPGVYRFEDATHGTFTQIRILHPIAGEQAYGQKAATEETPPMVFNMSENSIDPSEAETLVGAPLLFNVIQDTHIVGSLQSRTFFDTENKQFSDQDIKRPGEGKIP